MLISYSPGMIRVGLILVGWLNWRHGANVTTKVRIREEFDYLNTYKLN